MTNMTVFSIGGDNVTPAALSALSALPVAAIQPLTGAQESRVGLVPVFDGGPMIVNVDNYSGLRIAIDSRKVPRSTLAAEVETRCKTFEEERGFVPGRKLRREFLDRAREELLPKAFVERKCFGVMVDHVMHRLYIQAAGGVAEETTVFLRNLLGTLDITPWTADHTVTLGSLFTNSLLGGVEHPRLALGETATLDGENKRIRYRGLDRSDPALQAELGAGARPIALQFQIPDLISVEVDSNGTLRQVRLLNTTEPDQGTAAATAEDHAGAALILLCSAVSEIVSALSHLSTQLQTETPAAPQQPISAPAAEDEIDEALAA